MFEIKVDVREIELIKKIKYLIETVPAFKDLKLNIDTLSIGDIIFYNTNNNKNEDILIFERKTLNDLSSSIKDGRYDEQSYRLNGSHIHNHNIIYLIEGDLNNKNSFIFKQRLDNLTLYSAMFSLLYYKGFSVFRTLDMSESATFICNTAAKLNREKDKKMYHINKQNIEIDVNLLDKNISLENNNDNDNGNGNDNEMKTNEMNEKDYCKVIKKVKKENITPNNIGEIMLCQIPGISSQTAIAIMNKYKNLPNLIEYIIKEPESLNEIYTVDANNKKRKINKNCINNLKLFLSITINNL